MNEAQVIELFEMLASAYPNFVITDLKVDVWLEALADQDFDKVKKRAKAHILKSTFQPTIAELRQSFSEENNFLKKMNEWKSNAAPSDVARMHLDKIKGMLMNG